MLNTKDVLDRLKALRVEKALGQDYIARKLGIDRSTYVRKEMGAIPITTEEWLKLAVAMEEEPAYFFRSAPAVKRPAKGAEYRLMGQLFSALTPGEKKDLVSCLRLLLKGVRRKKVRDTLEMLGKRAS